MTHKEYLKKIGLEIKIAKLRAGIGTKQLAKTTGLSEITITLVQAGKSDAHILTYKRIADALGIELRDIL